MAYIKKTDVIFLAGHNGMVGKSILKKFTENKYPNIITADKKTIDLFNFKSIYNFLNKNNISCVINAAAKAGGIISNLEYPADYMVENSLISNNLIISSYKLSIKKFIFLGSSCIYPKKSKLPIKENSLLGGFLEPSNEYYAIAKIHGLKMCEAINKQYNKKYISLMPTNLYGPNDKFDEKNSHVIPALIKKISDAKIKKLSQISIIGDGSAKRDFLYVDDLSNAIIKIIQTDITKLFSFFEKNSYHINIGSSEEISIEKLVKILTKIINYKGKIIFDKTSFNGVKSKILDNTKINKVGWQKETPLINGLQKTVEWYNNNFQKN